MLVCHTVHHACSYSCIIHIVYIAMILYSTRRRLSNSRSTLVISMGSVAIYNEVNYVVDSPHSSQCHYISRARDVSCKDAF
jgi:hypothetical protein